MKCKIGFVGIGHMSSAILDSIITNKFIDFSQVGLYTRNKSTLEKYKNLGFTIFDSSQKLSENSQMLLLGVKPQSVDEITGEIKNFNGVLISILAGVKMEKLHKYFSKVIRVMPNLPMTINRGAAAISYDENITKEDLNFVIELFKCSSAVEIIEEKFMDTIITVNGSTPAYVYYFIDVLVKDAVKRGIDFDVAKNLITETFIGASMMLQNSSAPIEEHIDAVCSKGGTTIEAITTMKEQGLDKILKNANDNCINRAIELGLDK